MSSRRAEIALSADEIDDYLAGSTTMILVTIGPDGAPDPVPMWYVVHRDGVGLPEARMRTWAKSQKIVNLRRDPRVSCLVEDGERYAELRGVQLTGRVELVEDPEWIADVMVGLARKYEGVADEQVGAVRAAALERAPKQVGLRLIVERIASWDHRKLNGGAR